MTIAEIASILLFGRAAGHSTVPATDLAAAARRVSQGWPRLRPPHGLALTGPSTAACWRGTGLHSWLALAVSGGYGSRARATSWRSVTRRLQASPDCLFCPAELRRPRAGFWPPRFPLRHQSFVASFRLGGNQHLTVAQRLDVVGIGWSTPAALLLRMSSLKLHRAGLVGDQRRARPQVILALRQQMPAEHRELASHRPLRRPDGHAGRGSARKKHAVDRVPWPRPRPPRPAWRARDCGRSC